jgi:cell division inhibitor SepF
MDELKKLTQPYEDDDDFFEGADVSFKPQPKAEAQPKTGNAQMVFENSFIAEDAPAPESQSQNQKAQSEGGNFFSNLGIKKPVRQKSANRERTVSFGGKEQQVILFSPKSFDEAGELVNYMLKNLTVVMTLESVPTDMARRLLDFLSGIAFALQGKITPVSAKTYFITPQNVDILGVQEQSQPETTSHYF